MKKYDLNITISIKDNGWLVANHDYIDGNPSIKRYNEAVFNDYKEMVEHVHDIVEVYMHPDKVRA